jgi:hypothetical protein
MVWRTDIEPASTEKENENNQKKDQPHRFAPMKRHAQSTMITLPGEDANRTRHVDDRVMITAAAPHRRAATIAMMNNVDNGARPCSH